MPFSWGFCLACFRSDNFLFSSSRLILDEVEGFVALRTFSAANTLLISSRNRSITTCLFLICERSFWEIRRSSPSFDILFLSFTVIVSFCSSVRIFESLTLNRSSTRVLTLLVCCPPGPLLFENLNVSSCSSWLRSLSLFSFSSMLPEIALPCSWFPEGPSMSPTA